MAQPLCIILAIIPFQLPAATAIVLFTAALSLTGNNMWIVQEYRSLMEIMPPLRRLVPQVPMLPVRHFRATAASEVHGTPAIYSLQNSAILTCIAIMELNG